MLISIRQTGSVEMLCQNRTVNTNNTTSLMNTCQL
uniref:Uncharacterized protein n=1 Tax=Siphoviridae sp. ctiJm4 TaxID=2827916 RepID=A0A8S5T157_9CAUD|nr:MAG TPA: hypothetical protein [Siphoviridae sp. ctiJm4]